MHEEALARIAIDDHLDSAIGRPGRAMLDATSEALGASAAAVRSGSQRPVLEELGPEVGAPDVGVMADLVGDRRMLVARAREWLDWTVRRHTIEAALLEGGLQKGVEVSRIYEGWDPSDDDLRAAVAALLCLSDDAKRGLAMLATIQNDRASRRYAAMARNWGDVRELIVACAAAHRIDPPPKPDGGDAGTGDPIVPRAVLRLRLGVASTEGRAPRAAVEERQRAVEEAMVLLDDPPHSPASRLALLAGILDVGHPTANELLRLAGARQGDLTERPLAPQAALTAFDVLDESPGLRPIVHAPTWARAAERLSHALAPLPNGDGRTRLSTTAAAMWVEAASGWARAGDAERALDAIDRAAPLAGWSDRARALARSSVTYIAGDAARALQELDAVQGAASEEPIAKRVAALAVIQRAELLASLGRAQDAAKAAVEGDIAAAISQSAVTDARGRVTRLALASSGQRSRNAPTPKPNPVTAPLPWIGFADHAGRWTESKAVGSALIDAVALWDAAIDEHADVALAFRYRLFARRGDAAPWMVPALAAAAKLIDGPPEAIETWLDAYFAIDARRVTLRAYAWSRAEAARWRGDAESATLWTARYHALQAIAVDPARAELAAFLGI